MQIFPYAARAFSHRICSIGSLCHDVLSRGVDRCAAWLGYSRRGVLSSVAAAVILVFSMNFLVHLFLALGEGDRGTCMDCGLDTQPCFRGNGLYLLYLRASNREPPSFHLFTARRIVAQ